MINEKVEEVQKRTVEEALDKLKKYHKCLIVRPTGFGKTKISLDIGKKFNGNSLSVKCYSIKVFCK